MTNDSSNSASPKKRTYWLTVRMTSDERQKLTAAQKKAGYKSVSEYSRQLLLQKPVKVIVHDLTRDKAIDEIAEVRKQLSGIANNFNQVVKRIHKIDQLPNPEFWIKTCTALQQELVTKTGNIQLLINNIHEQW